MPPSSASLASMGEASELAGSPLSLNLFYLKCAFNVSHIKSFWEVGSIDIINKHFWINWGAGRGEGRIIEYFLSGCSFIALKYLQ